MLMAAGIWVRLIRHTRIERDITVECTVQAWQDALLDACRRMDVPHPMILPRHERDWDAFSQVRFLPEHFVESVSFDRMEVEYIDPDKKKKNNPLYE